MDFEKKIKRLEEIIEKMEQPELPLEQSLKIFEEGVRLSKECSAELSTAEQKVRLLLGLDENGKPLTKDFTPQD